MGKQKPNIRLSKRYFTKVTSDFLFATSTHAGSKHLKMCLLYYFFFHYRLVKTDFKGSFLFQVYLVVNFQSKVCQKFVAFAKVNKEKVYTG